ncbi:hypothetical protein VTO73DRAFT_6892 [Trametes versicolor]
MSHYEEISRKLAGRLCITPDRTRVKPRTLQPPRPSCDAHDKTRGPCAGCVRYQRRGGHVSQMGENVVGFITIQHGESRGIERAWSCRVKRSPWK